MGLPSPTGQNGLGVAGVVLAGCSLPVFFIPTWIGSVIFLTVVLTALASSILGYLDGRSRHQGTGCAIAGVVVSGASLLMMFVFFLMAISR